MIRRRPCGHAWLPCWARLIGLCPTWGVVDVGFIRARGHFSTTGNITTSSPLRTAIARDGRECSQSRHFWYRKESVMVQNYGKKFEIIRADKATLVAIVFFLSLLALCWSLAFLTI